MYKKDTQNKKCVHDLSEQTTLIKSPKRTLIHPEIVEYCCTVCGRCFRYNKESRKD